MSDLEQAVTGAQSVDGLLARLPALETLLDGLDRAEGLAQLPSRLESLAEQMQQMEGLSEKIRDLTFRGEEGRRDLNAERGEREALAHRVAGLEEQVRALVDELVARDGQLVRSREIEERLLLQARALHRTAAELGEALSTEAEGPVSPYPE